MSIRNIYLYWIGKEYKLIIILRNLIYLHATNGKGYNIILINHDNINDYINHIPNYFYKLCPANQADFVRINVICDYGGIWLDSDTIILHELDTLFDIIENKNGFFIKQNNDIICNGVFGSQKQTPLMIEWKKQMLLILETKQEYIEWNDIGSRLLENIYKFEPELYNNYKIFNGLDNMYPINFSECKNEYIDKPYENYKNIIREYQPLIILTHSVYHSIDHFTEHEILKSNMPIIYFIKQSIINNDIKESNKFKFEYIYENKIWNNSDDNIPISGPGAEINNTKECVSLLNDFIYTNNCESVLDLGCGDLTWIQTTKFFSDNKVKYTGIDIVESLINSHITNFPENTFYSIDITKYKDYKFSSIIIIRDVIFHLKNDEILEIFNNIRNKFNFLFITSCRNNNNIDIFNKWFFSEKNIHKYPFNKSLNFISKLSEDIFNRDIYIYEHNKFYNYCY